MADPLYYHDWVRRMAVEGRYGETLSKRYLNAVDYEEAQAVMEEIIVAAMLELRDWGMEVLPDNGRQEVRDR